MTLDPSDKISLSLLLAGNAHTVPLDHVPGLQESKLKKPPLCPKKLELKTSPVCPILYRHGSCPARILEGAWITVGTGLLECVDFEPFFCAKMEEMGSKCRFWVESRMRARAWTWSRIGGAKGKVMMCCTNAILLLYCHVTLGASSHEFLKLESA
jgi:hypothetical protein